MDSQVDNKQFLRYDFSIKYTWGHMARGSNKKLKNEYFEKMQMNCIIIISKNVSLISYIKLEIMNKVTS